jgi:hypothetical protein
VKIDEQTHFPKTQEIQPLQHHRISLRPIKHPVHVSPGHGKKPPFPHQLTIRLRKYQTLKYCILHSLQEQHHWVQANTWNRAWKWSPEAWNIKTKKLKEPDSQSVRKSVHVYQKLRRTASRQKEILTLIFFQKVSLKRPKINHITNPIKITRKTDPTRRNSSATSNGSNQLKDHSILWRQSQLSPIKLETFSCIFRIVKRIFGQHAPIYFKISFFNFGITLLPVLQKLNGKDEHWKHQTDTQDWRTPK